MKSHKFNLWVSLTVVLAFALAYAVGHPIHVEHVGIGVALLGTMGTYDTTTLLEVQRMQKVPLQFFLEKAFTRQINFETEYVSFDRVSEDYRRLACNINFQLRGQLQ